MRAWAARARVRAGIDPHLSLPRRTPPQPRSPLALASLTGLKYYGKQHVGRKGKSGVANMEGGLAGDSTGRDGSMPFLGAAGTGKHNKNESNLTSRGGLMCQKTGRDSDMDRRLYYGRSTKKESAPSEAPFHVEQERDSRFGK